MSDKRLYWTDDLFDIINKQLTDLFYDELNNKYDEKIKDITKKLNAIYGKIKKISFAGLTHSEKRDFLSKYITSIKVDLKSKLIEVVWK